MLKPFKNTDLLPISEAYQMIYEDAKSKNRHHARKWIRQNHPEALGRTLANGMKSDEEAICRELAGMMDNVKLADYKFLQGLARIYFDEMSNNPNDMVRMGNKLNGILKIISVEPHLSEYDRNLNGLSFKELDNRFSKAVKKNLLDDKEKIASGSYSRNSDYDIIRINDFEEAKKYGKYTSWCVTYSEKNYNTYTHDDFGVFYFCLKKGFENVPKRTGPECPLDDYGLSMIAVLVGDDGSLWHCTCRWNHENGGNDNIMDTQQISELLGVNFYDVFKPRSVKELMASYEKMRVDDDRYCRRNGCIKIKDGNGHFYYIKVVDGEIQKMQIVGDGLLYEDGRGFIKIGRGPYTIYPCAFQGNTSIKSLIIPYGVTSIESSAFHGCTGLTSVTIPNSVKSIGEDAFGGCSSLTNVTIPDSVMSIGDYAFERCSSLTSVTIPDKVTSIGYAAFRNCSELTSITIPNSVMSIWNYAFYDCSGLKSVTIPNSVTNIGDGAFYGCRGLTSVTIPDSVTSISDCAFSRCSGLTSITIPDSVTSIGWNAFFGCSGLTSVTIPDSVTSIGDGAFEGCNSLRTINAHEGIRRTILSQIGRN